MKHPVFHLAILVLRVLSDGRTPDGSDGAPLDVSKLGGTDLALSWGASCSLGDSDYALYSGSLGSFDGHTPVLCSTGGETSATITGPEGDVYFLVVPHDGATEGSYGLDDQGSERLASPSVRLP